MKLDGKCRSGDKDFFSPPKGFWFLPACIWLKNQSWDKMISFLHVTERKISILRQGNVLFWYYIMISFLHVSCWKIIKLETRRRFFLPFLSCMHLGDGGDINLKTRKKISLLRILISLHVIGRKMKQTWRTEKGIFDIFSACILAGKLSFLKSLFHGLNRMRHFKIRMDINKLPNKSFKQNFYHG